MYLRATYSHPPTTILVTAKTEVAPLKKISIPPPRLELGGASLLAKLLTSTRLALNISLSNVFAWWCDSSIVLHWLDGSSRRFKIFMGNRISDVTKWSHIPTECNLADCASRGLLPKYLLHHRLWWDGPNWLHIEPIQWPPQPLSSPLSTPKLKAVACNVAVPVPPDGSYDKLVKVNAWILRFVSNLKFKHSNHSLNW